MANRGVHSARHRTERSRPEADRPGYPDTQPGTGSAGAPRRRAGRSRGVAIRAIALLCAVGVVVVVAVTGIGPAGLSVTQTVSTFLLDWESGDYSAAAMLTTGNPADVTASLQNAYSELGAADLVLGIRQITVHSGLALASFNASVNLGRDGLPWQYQGHFMLHRGGSGWRVVWSPAVIAPGLGRGDRLAVLTQVPGRASLEDSGGHPLLRRSPVFEVGVLPDDLKNPQLTAQRLATVIGLDTDADEMLGQIRAAPSESFLELVQLSPASYDHMRGKLGTVPGLIVRQDTTRLFDSTVPAITGMIGTETARVLVEDGEPYRPGTTVGLSGLEQAYQGKLAGTATTQVVVQDESGRRVKVLKNWPGHAGTAIRTTIDGSIQAAAAHALAGTGLSAAIVAIRAGGGQILAVADQQAPGMPAVGPLTGRYQPGQSFMIVSAAALLASGQGFSGNTPVQCYRTNQAGGQTFANTPVEPYLGPVQTFTVDFAHACSTAFVGLSLRLAAPRQLIDAATAFGIGARWQLQVPAFAGSMHVPASSGQQAADVIGKGTVQVSPLDMALAAGLVDAGSWHAPSLLAGPANQPAAPKPPFGSGVISQLKHLMWLSVRSGAAHQANLPGGAVFGQVGTAPLAGHHGITAIWFVGFRGNVAFAVLVFSHSAAFAPAALLARQFAASLPLRH